MPEKGFETELNKSSGRIWRFGDCELNELSRELKVRGVPVELESKPFEVLLQMLHHAGEVMTKEELLESVWPDVMVVDSSLATAISKVRKAIGEEEHQPIILTVPRVGYRLAVPVRCQAIAVTPGPELGFTTGEAVPGREQWKLSRRLDISGSSEVWVGCHGKTREQRVFKFASDGAQLRGLKREITVSRFLRESLGDRPEFVHILEWNLDTAPFFLESEYAGPNLAEWAEEQGGLRKIPVEIRLQLLIDVAKGVAAAHDVGVLHKDLKPANILITPRAGKPATGGGQVKIADFGSASLFEPGRLGDLGITNLGFTQTSVTDSALTGTLMYLAPEVLAGQSPSTLADVYALGVLLYQMLIGDFRQPIAPGWEAQVDDALLREDIAAAACGDPAKRLRSVNELVERLQGVEDRRRRRDELEAANRRAREAEQKVAKARATRPWVIAAGLVLVAGLSASFALYRRAASERDTADRQTAVMESMNRFLADDLLGRGNPFVSGKSGESLVEAIEQASPAIDRKFQSEPLVAAGLHQTIARALDNRTNYPEARREYDRAAALFQQAEGELSQDRIIVELQRAALEARSYESGSLQLAKSILDQQDRMIARISHPRAEIGVWDASAHGMVALIDNNAKTAAEQFESAMQQARVVPMFDESAVLTLRQRLAFAYIRLGNGEKAEQLLRGLIADYTRVNGAENPNVLRVRLNLAQAYMIQNKHAEAIQEANAIYPEFVSRLGPDHELTMQVLATRAQSEGSLGIWKDAIRDDLAIHDLAVRKQGAQSFFAVATLSDGALAMCRSGNYRGGEELARKAYDASRSGFGARAGLTGAAASTLGACLLGLGRLDEASDLLKQIDIAAVAQLAGDADWGAGVTLLEAQIAHRRGDDATARKYAQAVTPVFLRPNAEVYQRNALASLVAELDRRP